MSDLPKPGQPVVVTLAGSDGHSRRVNMGYYDIVWALDKSGHATWVEVHPGTLTPYRGVVFSRPAGWPREDQR